MDVACVVAAYDEAATIERTLDSLVGADCEVFVVVGGTDETATIAHTHPVVDHVLPDVVESGPAAARNQGARATDAEVVCFTDADTVVAPGWVARHASHYHDPTVVCVGGPLRALDGSRRDRLLFRLLSDWWYRASWPVGFVQASGNNCSYRRAALLEADGFDESLPFLEDTDCSMRVARRGRAVYDGHAWVATSTRRQHRDGYLGLLWEYAVGYARYLADRPHDRSYFRRR